MRLWAFFEFYRKNVTVSICLDGHDFSQLDKAFLLAKGSSDKPTVLIADTVMGKGISFMEDDANNGSSKWHHAKLTEQQYQQSRSELATVMSGQVKEQFQKVHPIEQELPVLSMKDFEAIRHKVSNSDLPDDANKALMSYLMELAEVDNRIIYLISDLTGSGAVQSKEFRVRFPDRYFDLGIREQTMIAVAGGLADSGKRPVALSYDAFVGLMAEQYRILTLDKLPVILWGICSGASSAQGDRTHQSNAQPSIYAYEAGNYFEPGRPEETFDVLVGAMTSNKPSYIRTSRLSVQQTPLISPTLHSDGAYILKETSGTPDIILVTLGSVFQNALNLTPKLEEQGIQYRIIHINQLNESKLQEHLKPLLIEGVPILTIHDAQKRILGNIVSGIITSKPATKHDLYSAGNTDYGPLNGEGDSNFTMRAIGIDPESLFQQVVWIISDSFNP